MRLRLLPLVLALTLPGLCRADDRAELAELRSAVTALTARITELESRLAQAPTTAPAPAKPAPAKPAPPAVTARSGAPLKLGGIVKTWWREEDPAANTMELRNARLYVMGQVSPDVKWLFQYDGATDTSQRTTDAPSLLDGKIMLNLDRAHPWRTDVHVGRFIPEVTRYQPVAIDTMDFVYYPRFLTGTGNVAVWRQHGLEFHHTWLRGRAVAGVVDTSVGNDNGWVGETDDAKDWYLRLDRGGPAARWWGSLWTWEGRAGTQRDERSRHGAFLEFHDRGIRALAEYAASSDETWGVATDREGLVLQAIHRPHEGRMAWAARWETWDRDTSLSDSDERWLTLGATWYLAGQGCFFTLNWIDKDRDPLAVPAVDAREIVGQFTLTF